MKGTDAAVVAESEGASLQATLLISILLRYPEISSVRFLPQDGCIGFTFLLRQPENGVCLASFEHSVLSHLDAFSALGKVEKGFVSVECKTYGTLTVVEVIREVKAFSRQELSMLISLIRDHFGDALVVETGDALHLEEQMLEEGLIDDILEDVRRAGPWRELMGFRDAGRVLIFNKNRHKARE
ncbi:MAG: hypothetical protein ACOYEP_00810 [Limnochordia bacterium]|jgi:hypothetical protein